MNLSLSIVLPVHNAQSTLARDVHLLLDSLPDITSSFEILILDNASTDQSEEIAHELSLEFPQVLVTRHSCRLDQQAVMQTALTKTSGDVVFMQEEGAVIRSAEIRRLWDMRHDEELVIARAEMPRRTLAPHMLDRLAHWGEQLRDSQAAAEPGSIQMIRREAIEDLARSAPEAGQVRVCQISGPKHREWDGSPSRS